MQLSAAAIEVVRLYKQLHAFKEDAEFALFGFAQGGPYNAWLRSIESLQDSSQGPPGFKVLNELGFFVGDIWGLGMAYMYISGSLGGVGQYELDKLEYIEDMERTIKAGLALALCQ